MKRNLLFLLLLLLSTLILAQENPISSYLKEPGIQNYKLAVDFLAEMDAKSTNTMQAKINLAYISNAESKRLMSIAIENLDKLSLGACFALANLYLGMEKYPEAIKIYNKINTESPKWSCPWRHKGEALYRSGDFAGAALSLEESIKTNENHYDAYLWYAKALYELKKYPEALAAMEKAFTLNPEEEESHFDEELPDDEIQTLYNKLKVLNKK